MPKIEVVDYKELQRSASTMREGGSSLMSTMQQAFAKIGAMSSAWYGKRYNMLVDEFNKVIPALNEISQLTMVDFPNALDTIAVNYARADMEELSLNQSDASTKINEIQHNQSVGLRFITAEVESVHGDIKTSFENAAEQLNNIESICNSLPWTSEAQEAFVAKFKSLKGQIQQAFDNIINAFNTLVDGAKSDMAATESANTIG